MKWTTLSSAVNTGLRMAQLVILARFLSPEEFGLMSMVWIIIGFIQIYIDFGISSAIIHRQDATANQLSTLYWLNVIVGLATFIVVWVGSPLVASMFHEPRLVHLLHAVAVVFLITPWGQQFQILLQKELKFNLLAKQEVFATVSGVSATIVLAAMGHGVWALVLGLIVSELVKTLLLLFVSWDRYKPGFHFERHHLKGYLSFGLYQMGERSVNYLGQRFDQLLIGAILGAHTLGYYNFAYNLVIQPISRINPIVTRVVFPVFSKVQSDEKRLKKGYLKVISLLTSINAPLLIGLAVSAPVAIPLIFGETWTEAVRLVQILSIVGLIRSVGNPIGSLQLARGRADLGFKWNLALLFVYIPSIYLGGKLGGAVGIALATMMLQIILLVPSYYFLVRTLIGDCARDYFSEMFKPIMISLEMAIIVLALSLNFRNVPPSINLAIQLVAGAVSYIGLTRIHSHETITEFKFILAAKHS